MIAVEAKYHYAKVQKSLNAIEPNHLKLYRHLKNNGALSNEKNHYTNHFMNDAGKYDDTFKSLHKGHLEGLKAYKGPAYTKINGFLRKGDKVPPEIENHVKNIKSAINKFKSKSDMVAIRGLAARPEWVKENAVKGATISDKGFMSVSTRPATVSSYANAKKSEDHNRQSVIMHLHIPKGTHILPLSPSKIGDKENAHKEDENEYLLHDDSKWHVKSVKHAKINGNPITILNMHYKKDAQNEQ